MLADTPTISVAIIDDQRLFLDGISSLLAVCEEVEVVGIGQNGSQAMEICHTHQPQVILLDLSMPEESGEEVLQKIKAHFPHTKVIMLTVHDDYPTILRCMQNGAMGYILKINGKDELLRAIIDVAAGRRYLDPKVLEELFTPETASNFSINKPPLANRHGNMQGILTKRETEILKLLAQGKTSEILSKELFISVNTVDTHRKTIISKLEAKNIAHAVSIAMSMELI